jgi:uncharacterized protein (TIGR02265 family)
MAEESRVVYSHTVEALISRLFERHGLLEGRVLERLRELGVDPQRPRDTPVHVWRQVVRLAAEVVAPGQPEEDALREVGREMIRGFEASLVGRSLFIVVRLMGVRRTLERVAQNYRTADNATQVTTRTISANEMELCFTVEDGIPFPSYTEGILIEGARLGGAKSELKVEYVVQSPNEVTYRVRW